MTDRVSSTRTESGKNLYTDTKTKKTAVDKEKCGIGKAVEMNQGVRTDVLLSPTLFRRVRKTANNNIP